MLANLRALFGVVVDIVLLRRGPEHLPVSQALLFITVALSTLASAFMGVATGTAFASALLQAIVGALVMLLWFHIALGLAEKRERFPQMMTALFAVNALFMPILIPLVVTVFPYIEKPDPANPPPAAPLFLATAIGLWAFVVEVRVVRATFELESMGRLAWLGAVLLVLGEFFAAAFIAMLLFGGPARPA
jgi:hypothetical protein